MLHAAPCDPGNYGRIDLPCLPRRIPPRPRTERRCRHDSEHGCPRRNFATRENGLFFIICGHPSALFMTALIRHSPIEQGLVESILGTRQSLPDQRCGTCAHACLQEGVMNPHFIRKMLLSARMVFVLAVMTAIIPSTRAGHYSLP